MELFGIFGLLAALLIAAGCVRACDVFRQLERESQARAASLYAYAAAVHVATITGKAISQ